jgi:carboxybiotin decarboxylase
MNTKKYLLPILAFFFLIIPACLSAQTIDYTSSETKLLSDTFADFLESTGFAQMRWDTIVMLLIACVLLYLAIVKKFEPLLLMPISFGMLLTNLPGGGIYHPEIFANGIVHWEMFRDLGGLFDFLYLGVKLEIYPCLIFVGVGAMTDFGPMLASPKSLILGAAAQLGVFVAFLLSAGLNFTFPQAASIGIIGGADGPTAIFLSSKLAPELLGPIAIAAYSYMALVPVIQPPIMRLLTTKKERGIRMKQMRNVSRKERIIFPIFATVFISLLLPPSAPLIGSLMLGNLMRECGVVERLNKTAQNELMNIVTIFLGLTVGGTATATSFLNIKTIEIMIMGVLAFAFGTAGGVLLAKFMNLFTKNKINPLIGSAGVSAVPMAARVSQVVGQETDPHNYLLMHAMGPNVAGVIGTAVAAGLMLTMLG